MQEKRQAGNESRANDTLESWHDGARAQSGSCLCKTFYFWSISIREMKL